MLLAGIGWYLELQPTSTLVWQRVALLSIRALGVSDGDLTKVTNENARLFIQASQIFGVVFSLSIAGRILLFTLGTRFAEFRLRGRSKHDVIIGAGPAAFQYAALSQRKTTHTADGMVATLGRSATLGRVGTLKHQLRRAGAQRAKRIVVDEGDDAATWQTAQTAAKDNSKTDVLAHIRDPWINERLSRASPEARLRTFSYAGGVARQIMLAHPPYLLARRYGQQAQHILVIGFGPVGQAIVREFLVTSIAPDQALMITAIDPNIAHLQSDFLVRAPGLTSDMADFGFIEGDLLSRDGAMLDALAKRTAQAKICAVYVAIDGGTMPLSFGVILRDRAEELGIRAPIFICAQYGAGLTVVRQGAGNVGREEKPEEAHASASRTDTAVLGDLQLASFGSWRDALDGCGLFEPELDGAARRFHERFLAHTTIGATGPANVSWDKLDDDYRVANRRAAAHIRAKAAAVGYNLDNWLSEKTGFRLTHELPPAAGMFDPKDEAQVDMLAQLEHRRWMVDRALSGWRNGPERDSRLKIHPAMKPWADLPEGERNKDRSNLLQVMAALADVSPKGKRAR
jgi:voltage-gated potassium channel Kch